MTALPPCVVIDFETWRIEARPAYPPRPVGVSIKWPDLPSRYYAWGHASDNNCTEAEAKAALLDALDSPHFLLFHNAKFDIDVLCVWLGIELRDPRLHWTRLHDTSFLAFLCDPHARSHGLKALAEQHLNWPAEEKDEIALWAWDNRAALNFTVKQLGWLKDKADKHGEYGPLEVTRLQKKKTSDGGVRAGNPMLFMPWVPGGLAGRYAEGDTDRTAALFELMYGSAIESGMAYAYDTERELMPILLENERDGIRVDMELLEAETPVYEAALEKVEGALRARLGAPDLNFDADQDFAMALIRAGIVSEESFERTPKKREFRVGKESLKPDMFSDPLVASAIGYRNRLKTCLTMFMLPWLRQARAMGGRITTNWNQTRGDGGGTRTGRPSTYEHNFLNISKSFADRPDGFVHPDFLNVPPLPLCRKYLLPDEGELWGHRDFSGQELRVFANFEGGMWEPAEFAQSLLAAYLDNPSLDPHAWVRDNLQAVVPRFQPPADATAEQVEEFNVHLRTQVKVTNFRRLYGGGAGAAAQALGISDAEAKEFCAFHDKALPGRKRLDDWCKKQAKLGLPIRTWGGRIYYVEDAVFIDGRLKTFDYKLINYLIQGSAADITKRALIDWYNHPERRARFLVTVYDEINISMPKLGWERQMAILRETMCADRLRCPMLSDGKVGERWGELQKCE